MIKHIVFDVGNVLIDWNPGYLYGKVIQDKNRLDYFMSNVMTMDWIEEMDRGKLIEDAVNEHCARHPEFEAEIRLFQTNWLETIGGVIQATVDLKQKLKQAGYGIWIISNYAAENWEKSLDPFPFLADVDGAIVSGLVNLKKPEPAIYDLFFKRYKLKAEECVFIDDRADNIAAAEAAGMVGHVFTSAEKLEGWLKEQKIL